MTDRLSILTINSGSSSIKFSLYRMGPEEGLVWSGNAEGIGFESGSFRIKDGSGRTVLDSKPDLLDHRVALERITGWLQESGAGRDIAAVGHRIVHGGTYAGPRAVSTHILTALDELIPFAPDHLPHEISAVREIERLYPGMRQVACFDTAFHRTMPEVARLYALPEDVRRHGVVRYGFHGLSYEYILNELRKEEGPRKAEGKVIVAHLGNGASMGAFKNGKSTDTTMGFTPAGGLVMSTRSGDLDPGVIVYLLKEKRMDAAALNRLVNKQSGLIGISSTSPDMQKLLDSAARGDDRAKLAIDLFCYQSKKFIGALAAVLGGLDELVFTGGIGEHAPPIRDRICRDMEFLGICLDSHRNKENQPVISADGATVTARVMRTNEELMIARHTYDVIRNGEP